MFPITSPWPTFLLDPANPLGAQPVGDETEGSAAVPSRLGQRTIAPVTMRTRRRPP